MTLEYICLLVLFLLVIIRERKDFNIPNELTVPGLIIGLALALWSNTIVPHLAGMGLGFILCLPFWRYGLTGAGTVKLAAAVGAISGPIAGGSCAVTLCVVLAIAIARHKFFTKVESSDHKHRTNTERTQNHELWAVSPFLAAGVVLGESVRRLL